MAGICAWEWEGLRRLKIPQHRSWPPRPAASFLSPGPNPSLSSPSFVHLVAEVEGPGIPALRRILIITGEEQSVH
ncbi:hypothetical protein CRG98_045139 [Punica granatum]|uniref:Uncharacterized protein n=1 Tax=Punica granatum TaxID=22663 RepID=A0A2I0HRY9_PUNGR|nr:hypothetical protein CRG98_045139 [Punica granatum]